MGADDTLPDISTLSYLDASKVTSPAGVLAGLDVLTPDGEHLGSIQGVVIDAAARRVRYLAVEARNRSGKRCYVAEADQLGQLDDERKALRLRVDIRQQALPGLDTQALRAFSDEDVLTAMFAPRAA